MRRQTPETAAGAAWVLTHRRRAGLRVSTTCSSEAALPRVRTPWEPGARDRGHGELLRLSARGLELGRWHGNLNEAGGSAACVSGRRCVSGRWARLVGGACVSGLTHAVGGACVSG